MSLTDEDYAKVAGIVGWETHHCNGRIFLGPGPWPLGTLYYLNHVTGSPLASHGFALLLLEAWRGKEKARCYEVCSPQAVDSDSGWDVHLYDGSDEAVLQCNNQHPTLLEAVIRAIIEEETE